MKNQHKNFIKNSILSLALVLSLSSCGSAKNVVGEMKSNKDIIANEVTSTATVEEPTEVVADSNKNSDESENQNVAYLADTEDSEVSVEDKADMSENTDETTDESVDNEKNNEDEQDVTSKLPAAIETENELVANDKNKSEPLEANTEVVKEPIEDSEKTEVVATDNKNEEVEVSEEEATDSETEIVSYIVTYNNIKKEYQATPEGLKAVVADGLAEIDSLDFLAAEAKSTVKAKLQAQNSVEDAIYFMGHVRANQIENLPSPKVKTSTGLELAKVVNIIDSENIEIEIAGERKSFKLLGLSAPKLATANGDQYYANKTLDFVEQSLVGKNVFVDIANSQNGLSGYLWIAKPKDLANPSYGEIKEQSFNGILVAEGYANASANPGEKFVEFFNNMQNDAIKNRKGMWY